MIIEWTGCTGTGKSTLCEGVYKNLLSSGVNVRKPLEIFLGRTIAKAIKNESIRSLLLDVLVLPWSIFSAVKHRHFVTFCLKTLNNNNFSSTQKILFLRSIIRKTGLYLFLNDFCNESKLTVLDEGTVHIIHLLFANGDPKYCISTKEIERFCELVPLPDLIIHIMASESEVIKRTLNREDKPLSNASPDCLKHFITQGLNSFKILNDLNPWEKKTITYFNPDNSIENTQDVALITNQILEKLHPKKV